MRKTIIPTILLNILIKFLVSFVTISVIPSFLNWFLSNADIFLTIVKISMLVNFIVVNNNSSFVLSLVIPTRVQLTSTGGRLILRSVNLDIHWWTSTELKEDIQQFKKTDYYEWNFA